MPMFISGANPVDEALVRLWLDRNHLPQSAVLTLFSRFITAQSFIDTLRPGGGEHIAFLEAKLTEAAQTDLTLMAFRKKSIIEMVSPSYRLRPLNRKDVEDVKKAFGGSLEEPADVERAVKEVEAQ